MHESQMPAVLIVDDTPANRMLVEAQLEELECELVLAGSGAEALRLLGERDFALVILDVHMPGMSGYEVARIAREELRTRLVPFLFVTASDPSQVNVSIGYDTGAVDYLFKPVNPFILQSKVRVFLELHANRQALELANAELRRTRDRLVQAAKMASLGELLAGIAHEINNPLSFVLNHLDTAQKSLGLFETAIAPIADTAAQHWMRATARLSEMRGGLDRIRDLVLKLGNFSRLDEGQRATVNVKDCIDSTLSLYAHRFEAGTKSVVTVNDDDELSCFPGLFTQALSNLVSNALDAAGVQGTVAIVAGRKGDVYELAVSDSGKGFAEADLPKLLDPFFTTKPVGQGTGLGLSITYSIVKQHEGTLDLQNGPDGGGRVVVRIPLTHR